MAIGTMRPATRRRATEQARELLQPGTRIRDAGMGRRSFIFTQAILIAMGLFGLAAVISLALGKILYPGAGLIAYVVIIGMPWRTVFVADQGVALMSRNPWTGRIGGVLALLPVEAMSPQNATRKGKKLVLLLGDEKVTFTEAEFDRLSAAAREVWGRRTGRQQEAG